MKRHNNNPLNHHNKEYAYLRLKLAASRALVNWLGPMSQKDTKRVLHSLKLSNNG